MNSLLNTLNLKSLQDLQFAVSDGELMTWYQRSEEKLYGYIDWGAINIEMIKHTDDDDEEDDGDRRRRRKKRKENIFSTKLGEHHNFQVDMMIQQRKLKGVVNKIRHKGIILPLLK